MKRISLKPPKLAFWVRIPASTLALLGFLLTSLSAASARHAVHIFHADKVWSVQADGNIEEVPIDFDSGENEGGVGTTAPVVSPDDRRVAFTKDNDLWIDDLKSGARQRLTHHGRKSDDTFASVYVLITGWSADGKQILYNVAHSDAEDPEGIDPPREIRAVPYGFRILDVANGGSKAARLAGEFQLWLPDGRFLLTSSDADYLHGALMAQAPGQELPDRLTPVRGLWGQADVSRDGKWLVASLGQPAPRQPDQMEDETALTSRIVKMDLKNGALTDVTAPGSWSEFQTPRFSPGGARLSWVRQGEPDASGFASGAVLVDGKEIGTFSMPVEPRWIDDNTLVISHAGGIDVIQADGKVIIHRS